MRKIRIFHLPVFIIVIIGLALALYLHISQPRESLLDYALTLKDGQFICETGRIYEAVADYPTSGRIYAKRVGEVKGNFKVNFKNTPAEKLLPHEFAMQMTDYGSIYIGSDGSVWHDTHEEYNENNALLLQYLTPAAVLDSSNAAELNIYDGDLYQDYTRDLLGIKHKIYNYYALSLDYAIIHTSSSTQTSENISNVEFSVKLKDGWYAIPSTNLCPGTIRLPNIGFDTQATAQCRLSAYDAATGLALACGEFELFIKDHRIHISDYTPQTYDLN